MARIFVCYRREDSSGHAGRLYDRLQDRFGDDVFMDIDAIGPGVDYERLIDDTIDTVEVVIVVIGRQWLSAHDVDGSRRLDDPKDLVRQEVSVALARDVLVIPVLVQGATLPQPEDLPTDLVGLARHNSFEISDGRWNYDADRLVQAVEQALSAGSPAPAVSPVPSPATDHQEVARSKSATRGLSGSTPTVVAASGALLVLLFGLLVLPTWHDERIWFRVLVALAVVALTAVGLMRSQWRFVMTAGATGLAGFVIWVLMLMGGHELSELTSLETDGVTNALFLVGSGLVFAGGWLGAKASPGQTQTS